MAKTVHNDVLDGALNTIKNNATLVMICSQQPTTRAEAVTTYALADIAVTSSDFTVADGDSGGRKVTVAAKASVTVDLTGTATHVAIVDGTRLLYVTTCTSQALTQGGAFNTPAWKITLNDPS